MVLGPPMSNEKNLPNLFDNLTMTVGEVNTSASSMVETLTSLRFALLKLSSENVYQAVTNSALESLIRVGSSLSGESLDLCRDIFDYVLSCIPSSHLLKRFPAEVLLALNSTCPMIKYTFLHAIKRAAETDQSSLDDISTTNSPIFIAVCRCLSDDEVYVFQEAKLTIIAVAKSSLNAIVNLFSSSVITDTVKQMIHKDSIKRFRLHEVTSDLCQLSPEILNLFDKASFVTLLLNEIHSSDVLSQLNALELLTRMASGSEHCLQLLYVKGVLPNLYIILDDSQDNPDSSFLFPAVMKFFGHLACIHPKDCCKNYPKFLNAVFHLVINFNLLEVGQRLLAFDTLGLLASVPEGKTVLMGYDAQMERCMKCFAQAIREGPMEMRVRHMEALTNVLKLEVANQTDELLAANEKWFSWMDRSAIELLFSIFKQPFPNIHCATGELFKTLVVQKWGQSVMMKHAGFVEYLLNRNTETTNEGRFVKFEIIDLLLKSPSETLDSNTMQRFKQYHAQGPYFLQGQLDVAMADA